MELWIRSQNKEQLAKITGLILVDNEIRGFTTTKDYYELGTYSTKERALEVLDEIQEAQLGNYHYKCPSNVKVSNNEDTIVYEMPLK